jgi:hypothetical protein
MKTFIALCFVLFVHAAWADSLEKEIIIARYPSGEKSGTITFIDQEKILLKGYHQNGKLRNQQTVKNGYADDEYISWFENGQVSVKGQYRVGKPVGKFIYYREDGTISEERIFTEDGEISAESAKQIAEDAKMPEPIPSYRGIFQLIAKDCDIPQDMDSLLELAADSTLRKHQKIDKYEEVISIEAQYYGNKYGIRGAQNGGSFYIFGRRGDTYEHIGTLEGSSLNAGTLNDQLIFYTSLHWSAAEAVETTYKWNGRMFMKVEQKLYQYGENGQKTMSEDFMKKQQ